MGPSSQALHRTAEIAAISYAVRAPRGFARCRRTDRQPGGSHHILKPTRVSLQRGARVGRARANRSGEPGGAESKPQRDQGRDAAPASEPSETADAPGGKGEGKGEEDETAVQAFKRVFWEEVGKDGGTPFLARMNANSRPLEPAAQGAAAGLAATPVATTPGPAAQDGPAEDGPQEEQRGAGDVERLGFWQRCTIGGLLLAVIMVWYTATHYELAKTLTWIKNHPESLALNAIDWEVVSVLTRRLLAPSLTLGAAWCALRSHWRVMWSLIAASFTVSSTFGIV